MDNCIFRKNEIVNGIKHEICTNEDLKKINKSNDKDLPCIGNGCGKFEEKTAKKAEAK